MTKNIAAALSLTLCMLTAVAAYSEGTAQTPAAIPAPAQASPVPIAGTPVTLDVPESGATMKTALDGISKQTGQAILCDRTVMATLGASHIVQPTLDAMLRYLKTLEPGLSYQEVYVPADKPLPTGDSLARMVAALQSVSVVGLVVPASDTSPTITFTRTNPSPSAAVAPTPAGMRAVYLVTDSSIHLSLYANGLAPSPGAAGPGAALPTWGNGQTPPVAAPGTMAGINPGTLGSSAAARQAWLAQRAAVRAQMQQQAQQGQQGPVAPGDSQAGSGGGQ